MNSVDIANISTASWPCICHFEERSSHVVDLSEHSSLVKVRVQQTEGVCMLMEPPTCSRCEVVEQKERERV